MTISKRLFSVFFSVLLAGMLFSCGKKDDNALDCPFTELDWDSTAEDVIAKEGEDHSSYDSIYGGLCYTYPKEYNSRAGTVKYMFDGEDRLVCVAWAYSAASDDDLAAVYDEINDSVAASCGDSGSGADGVGNYGNVWHLAGGDIVLTTMATSEMSVLQYAYLHPLVSKQTTE